MNKMMRTMLAAMVLMAGSMIQAETMSLKIKEVRTKNEDGTYNSTYTAYVEQEIPEETRTRMFEAPENSVVKIRSGAGDEAPATITTELGYVSDKRTDKAKLKVRDMKNITYNRVRRGVLDNKRNKTRRNLRSHYRKSNLKMRLKGQLKAIPRTATTESSCMSERDDADTDLVVPSIVDGIGDGLIWNPQGGPVIPAPDNPSMYAPGCIWGVHTFTTVEVEIDGELWHKHEVHFEGRATLLADVYSDSPEYDGYHGGICFDVWNISAQVKMDEFEKGAGFYDISGTVMDNDGNPVEGIELKLHNRTDEDYASAGRVYSNSNGYFSFGARSSDHEYYITAQGIEETGGIEFELTEDQFFEFQTSRKVVSDDGSWYATIDNYYVLFFEGTSEAGNIVIVRDRVDMTEEELEDYLKTLTHLPYEEARAEAKALDD